MQHKIDWAIEQMKNLEVWNSGYGFEAIQANIKLKAIKAMPQEEFEQAAIIAYDAQH